MAGAESLRDLRARAAHDSVLNWGGRAERLTTHVKGLPVLIRRMGLTQAVALLASRSETRPLADELATWMLTKHPARPLGAQGGGVPQLLQRLTALPSATARALEEEGLRYAEALKLFSGGLHGA